MVPRKPVRFAKFIEMLREERSASNRYEALALMTTVMNSVEDSYGVPFGYNHERMHVYSFDTGWKDLDKNPCRWDDIRSGRHGVLLFDNGRIIITQIHEPKAALLDKAGS